MRSRWLVSLAALAVIAVAGALVLLTGNDDGSRSGSPPAAGEETAGLASLPARSVTAGAVEISIEPLRIDGSGAVFLITMDTHSEELAADLAGTATLEVGGVEWTGATWSGDGPGGHHREGELEFEAAGQADGSATLSIGGFATPVEATWALGA